MKAGTKTYSERKIIFPTGLIFLIVVAIIAAIVLNKTKIGRYIFAIGSNKELLDFQV